MSRTRARSLEKIADLRTFPQLVSTYLETWEGHTSTEGFSSQRVADRIVKVTLDELNTEYNALSQQQLWNDPLINLFYNEILRRLLTETTFSISTAWRNINDWSQNPFVTIRVGFEESYPVTDIDRLPIHRDDTSVSSFTLMNDSFPEDFQERIIRLLFKPRVNSIIQIGSSSVDNTPRIQIIGLENAAEPDERLIFLNQAPLETLLNGQIGRVSSLVVENGDFNILRRMLDSLRHNTYEIIDPFSDQRINELINLPQANNVMDGGGLVIEGDSIIDTGPIDQEEEESISDI